MFENLIYIKSDDDKMNIVWIMLIKITVEYTITKIDVSFILYFNIIFFCLNIIF